MDKWSRNHCLHSNHSLAIYSCNAAHFNLFAIYDRTKWEDISKALLAIIKVFSKGKPFNIIAVTYRNSNAKLQTDSVLPCVWVMDNLSAEVTSQMHEETVIQRVTMFHHRAIFYIDCLVIFHTVCQPFLGWLQSQNKLCLPLELLM